MRIERLSFQAFGPYVERQDLCFQDLEQHHLFLLRGQTGAGKTAILDAITYALYGKSSGGDRGEFERMRCRSAKAEDVTFVELIFTLHGHRYRFYREIIIGHKRSGEELYKVTVNGGTYDEDVFMPFYENCKKALLEEKATELIGLSHAQFIQVMILPQGKFERLLTSKSEEKQEILKTLFQSERWTMICDELSERLKANKLKLDEQQQTMMTMLQACDVSSLEELDDLTKEKEQCLKQLQHEVAQKKQQKEEAARLYEEQVQLHHVAKRAHILKEQQVQLASKQKEIDELRKEVIHQEERIRLQPYVEAQEGAYQKEQELHMKLEQNKQRLQTTQTALQRLLDQEEQIKQTKEQIQLDEKHVEQLQEQLTLWKERSTQLQKQRTLEQQTVSIQEEVKQIQQALQNAKAEEKALLSKQEELSVQAARLPMVMQKLQRLKEMQQETNKEQELQATISSWHSSIQQKQTELTAMLKQEQELEAAHEQVYQAYISNSAALLSSLLKENTPCPVCGSCEHPHIARVTQSHVELQELKRRKQALEHAKSKRQEQEAWLMQAKQRLTELNNQYEQQKEVVQALWNKGLELSQYEETQAVLTHLEQLQKQLPNYKQQLQLLKTKQETLELQQSEKEARYQMISEQLLILTTQNNERFVQTSQEVDLQGLSNQITALKQNINEQQHRIFTWEQQTRTGELQLSSLQTTIQLLQEDHQKQKILLEKAIRTLTEENHTNIPMEQLQKPYSSVPNLIKTIEEYDNQMMQVRASLKEVQAQLENHSLRDVTELSIQANEMDQYYQASLKEMLALSNLCDRLKQVHSAIQKIRGTYETAMISYTKQSEFVKAMRGDTSIGIERYVLGIMLSSITQQANQLLKNVHGGRYQIYRSDEASGRTRKFGLELSIYDTYSCSMRSVVSLSGGEKFLVSLALSLALSTVVQARNGGVVMETMFIDEGFGSLDEQSLSDALQILSSMSCGKAMIGIISHVELLKENIPYGIEVSKHRDGSSCKLLV